MIVDGCAWQVFGQMTAFYVFMDFSFYWVHRALHHPSIYK
jgi:sterol desaturase/sphingolipid hydroxylase (fatty acid hydroxylase superfamily)